MGGRATEQAFPPLLGRETELAEIDRLLAEARGGAGQGLLIEGPAGIGKTVLVGEASERAAQAGLTVLSARGGELEQNLSFGIVRQLFEHHLASLHKRFLTRASAGAAGPAVRMLDPAGDAGASSNAPDEASLLHSLYWLCANLAGGGPLLVAVDDLQWADGASQRWLAYLAHRLESLPILLLLAWRTGETDVEREGLDALAGEPRMSLLRPDPLDEPSVSELVRRTYGDDVEDDFSRAFHHAGGGNPFITVQLIADAAEEGIEPTAGSAKRVGELGPEAVARDVLRRIERLGPAAASVARAVATLGTDAALSQVIELAELAPEDVSAAADALAGARVLRSQRPLEFIHPVVRSVVYEDITTGERSRWHMRAARLFAERGQPEDAAVHLLSTASSDDQWVVETLRSAARSAFAPETAAAYLRRALAEPPAREHRVELLLELGAVEETALDDAAVDHLAEARELSEDPLMRAKAGRALAGALFWSGRTSEAADACQEAIDEVRRVGNGNSDQGRELHLLLETDLWEAQTASGRLPPGRYEQLRGLVGEGTTFGERRVCATLAYIAPFWDATSAEAIEFAKRALAGETTSETASEVRLFYVAVWGLEFADALELADKHLQRAVASGRKRSSPSAVAFAQTSLAIVDCRRGELTAAQTNGRSALELDREHGLEWLLPMAGGAVADALTERAEFDEAEKILAETEIPGGGFGGNIAIAAFHRHNRARLRLIRGSAEQALADFIDAGRMMREGKNDHPAFYPWRSGAALAHLALGQRDEAKPLVAEELEMARAFGAPRSLGVSLRTAGLVQNGEAGIGLLREAVEVLEESPAQLERARAIVELGSALRRTGERNEGKEILLRGLDLAGRCGSTVLAARAREELYTLGARPRRTSVYGLESLTRSEERVARLAAEGLTNREIAQKLVVSPRTVENQLHHAYRKLDISSRKQLPDALKTGGS